MQQILTETTKTYRACTCLLLGLTSETTLGTQARQAQASAVLRITSTGVILWNWRRRIIMAWKGLGGLVHLGKNAWNLGSKLSSGRGPGIFEYQESKTPPCPCALPMPALSPPSPSPHPALPAAHPTPSSLFLSTLQPAESATSSYDHSSPRNPRQGSKKQRFCLYGTRLTTSRLHFKILKT